MNERDDSYKPDKLPIEIQDDKLLKALGGAVFGPNSKVILPSGKVMSGNEVQAFSSLFCDQDADTTELEEPDYGTPIQELSDLSSRQDRKNSPPVIGPDDNPLDSRFDYSTGDAQEDRDYFLIRCRLAAERMSRITDDTARQSAEESDFSLQNVTNDKPKIKWFDLFKKQV